MMFPAKLPKMLTMTAVVISGRGARYERDLFADSAYRGLNQIFPPIPDGELALTLWAHRTTFAPAPAPLRKCRYPIFHTATAAASCPDCDGIGWMRVDA